MRGGMGVGVGFGRKEKRGEGEEDVGEGETFGEKGKEGKRGNFARSKRGGRKQGGGRARGRRLPHVHPLMYVEVCSVCMSFYAHANTLQSRKMLNPELILYFETIPIDLSPTSVSSSRVCLK